MNIVQLTDGLGNQLFQYAFALALKKETGRDVCLDCSWFPEFGGRLRHATPRNYALGVYKISLPMYTPAQTFEFLYGKGLLAKIRCKLHCKKKLLKEAHMKQPHLACEDNKVIKGLFPKACYADSVREQLLKELEIADDTLDEKNKEVLAAIRKHGDSAVFAHIRRGDKLFQANPLDPVEYYIKAEKLIAEKTGKDLHLFVFSDDLEWVKENYHPSFPYTMVDINSLENGYLDLNLMRNCAHAIIANSTFSWWGAWLIENPNSVIVRPERWYPDRPVLPGFIPPHWYSC